MSNTSVFRGTLGTVHLSLPFELKSMLDGWGKVRSAMLKDVLDAFSRDEWAYLVAFLGKDSLMLPFEQSFGTPDSSAKSNSLLARPRGPVGLWLPNNVSLLGPLMLIVVSLSGCPLRMKAGSRSEDLTGVFLDFARKHAPDGALSKYLRDRTRHEVFSSDDPRNREIAATSAVRIVFGSDEAAAAIHALPHPLDSTSISFSDRRSEAWLEPGRCDDATLRDLIKVFAIYGQAGCTSPSRVILLDSDLAATLELRDRLIALWPIVIRRRTAMNIASDNVRSWQLARAAGWDSILVSENRAVISVGDYSLKTHPSLMEMRIVPATAAEAGAALPKNIQTIGHALKDSASLLNTLLGSNVARFVPLATMHHFETVWDGQDFFAQLFTYTRVKA
jgi:hypothetical protein